MLANEWKYFKLHNQEHSAFLLDLETFGGSQAHLYVNKGSEALPNLKANRVNSSNDETPDLTFDYSNLKEQESITGDYVVGVYCVEEGEFNLSWQPVIEKMILLQNGVPKKIKLVPEVV